MKRWLCGVLAALMALTTGCSAILNRDYTSVTPHSATPAADGESNTLRVGSYQELVNALVYLIGRGTGEGTIRFDSSDSDETAIQQMLDEACLEVVQEDPLGAYAVEYIKYSVTPIVGSYEADVQITYRRTREQVAAIVDATGTAAIRSELSEALADFSSEVVLRISYFEEDSEYIRQLMREAYLSNPASALDFPDAQITMYPESGQRRIVEVLLTYHQPRQTLESRRNSLLREADRLLLQANAQEADALEQLIQLVRQTCTDQEGSGSTAYDALLEGRAGSQGVALALALLCQRNPVPISCAVVDGQLNGVSHQWNVVQTAGGYRHVDLTQPGETVFRTDQEMAAAGYTWDSERVPVCAAEEETG